MAKFSIIGTDDDALVEKVFKVIGADLAVTLEEFDGILAQVLNKPVPTLKKSDYDGDERDLEYVEHLNYFRHIGSLKFREGETPTHLLIRFPLAALSEPQPAPKGIPHFMLFAAENFIFGDGNGVTITRSKSMNVFELKRLIESTQMD